MSSEDELSTAAVLNVHDAVANGNGDAHHEDSESATATFAPSKLTAANGLNGFANGHHANGQVGEPANDESEPLDVATEGGAQPPAEEQAPEEEPVVTASEAEAPLVDLESEPKFAELKLEEDAMQNGHIQPPSTSDGAPMVSDGSEEVSAPLVAEESSPFDDSAAAEPIEDTADGDAELQEGVAPVQDVAPIADVKAPIDLEEPAGPEVDVSASADDTETAPAEAPLVDLESEPKFAESKLEDAMQDGHIQPPSTSDGAPMVSDGSEEVSAPLAAEESSPFGDSAAAEPLEDTADGGEELQEEVAPVQDVAPIADVKAAIDLEEPAGPEVDVSPSADDTETAPEAPHEALEPDVEDSLVPEVEEDDHEAANVQVNAEDSAEIQADGDNTVDAPAVSETPAEDAPASEEYEDEHDADPIIISDTPVDGAPELVEDAASEPHDLPASENDSIQLDDAPNVSEHVDEDAIAAETAAAMDASEEDQGVEEGDADSAEAELKEVAASEPQTSRPSSPWTPSYSVTRMDGNAQITDDEIANAQDGEEESQAVESSFDKPELPSIDTEVKIAPNRPPSPWTPSYSVSTQGQRGETPIADSPQVTLVDEAVPGSDEPINRPPRSEGAQSPMPIIRITDSTGTIEDDVAFATHEDSLPMPAYPDLEEDEIVEVPVYEPVQTGEESLETDSANDTAVESVDAIPDEEVPVEPESANEAAVSPSTEAETAPAEPDSANDNATSPIEDDIDDQPVLAASANEAAAEDGTNVAFEELRIHTDAAAFNVGADLVSPSSSMVTEFGSVAELGSPGEADPFDSETTVITPVASEGPSAAGDATDADGAEGPRPVSLYIPSYSVTSMGPGEDQGQDTAEVQEEKEDVDWPSESPALDAPPMLRKSSSQSSLGSFNVSRQGPGLPPESEEDLNETEQEPDAEDGTWPEASDVSRTLVRSASQASLSYSVTHQNPGQPAADASSEDTDPGTVEAVPEPTSALVDVEPASANELVAESNLQNGLNESVIQGEPNSTVNEAQEGEEETQHPTVEAIVTPSFIVDDEKVDESAGVEEVAAASPVARPKSPYTPSYSVTSLHAEDASAEQQVESPEAEPSWPSAESDNLVAPAALRRSSSHSSFGVSRQGPGIVDEPEPVDDGPAETQDSKLVAPAALRRSSSHSSFSVSRQGPGIVDEPGPIGDEPAATQDSVHEARPIGAEDGLVADGPALKRSASQASLSYSVTRQEPGQPEDDHTASTQKPDPEWPAATGGAEGRPSSESDNLVAPAALRRSSSHSSFGVSRQGPGIVDEPEPVVDNQAAAPQDSKLVAPTALRRSSSHSSFAVSRQGPGIVDEPEPIDDEPAATQGSVDDAQPKGADDGLAADVPALKRSASQASLSYSVTRQEPGQAEDDHAADTQETDPEWPVATGSADEQQPPLKRVASQASVSYGFTTQGPAAKDPDQETNADTNPEVLSEMATGSESASATPDVLISQHGETLEGTAVDESPERPKSPYIPSYSVTSQGPPSPSILPQREVGNGDVLSPPASLLRKSSSQASLSYSVTSQGPGIPTPAVERERDEPEVTAWSLETKLENLSAPDQEEHPSRPSSPYSPSYQVFSQGSASAAKEGDNEALDKLEPLTPALVVKEQHLRIPGENGDMDATASEDGTKRTRRVSSTSSRFFPGGWFSGNSIQEEPEADTAMAAENDKADDKEGKNGWRCVLM